MTEHLVTEKMRSLVNRFAASENQLFIAIRLSEEELRKAKIENHKARHDLFTAIGELEGHADKMEAALQEIAALPSTSEIAATVLARIGA